jgi:hypothetical protein
VPYRSGRQKNAAPNVNPLGVGSAAHPVIRDGSGRRARHQTQSGSAVGCEPVVPLDYVGIRVSHMAKVVLVNNRTGNALSKPFTMSRRHEGREPGWRRSGRCERAHLNRTNTPNPGILGHRVRRVDPVLSRLKESAGAV